jgi:hypothetical protein
MTPEMALNICILLAIVGVAVFTAIAGTALLMLAVVHWVWPKMLHGDEISVFPTSTKSSCASTHPEAFDP